MAIQFAKMSYISRSQGRSSVAAAAYRSTSYIKDERTGEIHDYSRKQDLAYEAILLPKNADKQFLNRSVLWNAVEVAEVRGNAQTAKELVLALPRQVSVSDEQRIELARKFAEEYFVSKGVAVDLCIHHMSGSNPHAHLLITTRRIEGDQLSKRKARDLDPLIRFGRVQENDAWGKRWSEFQNEYFKQHHIDLEVDPKGLIGQIHLDNRICHRKNPKHTDLWQINESIKQKARSITLKKPKEFLTLLSKNNEIFTERDIARTVSLYTKNTKEFTKALLKIKSCSELIKLGTGADNQEHYTTKSLFEFECGLQDMAEHLKRSSLHRVSKRLVHSTLELYKLSQEQNDAMRYILHGGDIAIVVGVAGSGKSYSLRAANAAWRHAGYQVSGIAPTGKARSELEQGSGVESMTIASWLLQVKAGRQTLNKNSVIVLDEAGMVDSPTLFEVVDQIYQAKAKLILVGDPEQLQPIGSGAPLRALVERLGYASITTIRRQEQAWQRQATSDLAKGNVAQALDAYDTHQAIVLESNEQAAQQRLVKDFLRIYEADRKASPPLVLAHRNEDVDKLNSLLRNQLIDNGIIDQQQEKIFNTEYGPQTLAPGDRIILRKNDKQRQLHNGMMGTVSKVSQKQITVKLDDKNSKPITINPEQYPHFSQGYATTVHKSQGVTVDNALIYVAGKYWNRHLSYVALSRHKQQVKVYASKDHYQDKTTLFNHMKQEMPKDRILDFPLAFAQRRDLDSQHLWQRCKTKVINKFTAALDKVSKAKSQEHQPKAPCPLDELVVAYDRYQQAEKSKNRIAIIKAEWELDKAYGMVPFSARHNKNIEPKHQQVLKHFKEMEHDKSRGW